MNQQIDIKLMEQDSYYFPYPLHEERRMESNERKVFYAYAARVYRKHKVSFKLFNDTNLKVAPASLYFHDSRYIPYVKQAGYQIKVITGTYLMDAFNQLLDGTYVILSVKDEGSQALDSHVEEQFAQLGITSFSKKNLRHSFIWVARKISGTEYEVLYEGCSLELLEWQGELDDVQVSITSAGAHCGNKSTVLIDETEYSPNMRGINMVIFHPVDHTIESLNYDTFTTLYGGDSLFHAYSDNRGTLTDDWCIVSRAGGQIDGVNYTNCLEAMEMSYLQRKHRYFEIDFELTSDEYLVARHDWQPNLYNHLKQTKPPEAVENKPSTLQWFKETKILERYSPMTIDDVLQFLCDHRDAYLITDTKYSQPAVVDNQFTKLVEAADKYGYEVLSRVIPQLYTQEMLAVIEKVYPFPKYIYTLYQSQDSDEEVIEFVKRESIAYVTTYPERYKREFGAVLNQLGVKVFLHTINSAKQVNEWLRMNVNGFYTDSLSLDEILMERNVIENEVKTKRELLLMYMEQHYGESSPAIKKRLAEMSLTMLDEVSKRLFQARSLREAQDVLRL